MKPQRQGGFLIAKIHQISGRIFAKLLKENGVEEINPAQGRILFSLWGEGSMQVADLVKKTGLDKSTLAIMIDRLEKCGFVVRSRSETDRRVVFVQLTGKFNEYEKVYRIVSDQMIELFYKGLNETEIDTFEKTLTVILNNLHEKEMQT